MVFAVQNYTFGPMMETLLQWDTSMMHWINHGWSNPFFDFLFPFLRNKYFWLPLYTFWVAWIIFNFNTKQSLLALLFIALSIFAADTISSKLIKDQVQRPRPCHVEDMQPAVVLRVSCGSGFSFTSSHAANHFAIATFMVTVFGYFMRRWKYAWWVWAALVSLAQVYVGVHYPFDVMGGGLLGAIIGTSMGILCKHLMKSHR
jgi:undecaprenyl-diphosphatase